MVPPPTVPDAFIAGREEEEHVEDSKKGRNVAVANLEVLPGGSGENRSQGSLTWRRTQVSRVPDGSANHLADPARYMHFGTKLS